MNTENTEKLQENTEKERQMLNFSVLSSVFSVFSALVSSDFSSSQR